MNNLAGKPFALIGVHGLGYEPKKLKEVVEKEKLNWRSFADPRSISPRWAARGTPTYYIIDHKGIIQRKWIGYPGLKTIDSVLENLVGKAEASLKSEPK